MSVLTIPNFTSSAVSKEGSSAPRTGFFHDFTRGEVLAKKYSPESEEVVDLDLETARRLASGDPARTMDTNLGPYPYDTWKRWVSLTNKISDATLSRSVLHTIPAFASSTQFGLVFLFFFCISTGWSL